MLEPILACFFTSVMYLAMYKALPEDNKLRILFFPFSLLGTVFLSFTGYVETVGGASEQAMQAFFIINLIIFITAIFLITYISLIAFVAYVAERKARKIARTY